MKNIRETPSKFFKNFINFVKVVSRDFSEIKKRVVVKVYQNKKEFLPKILEKWWSKLK